MYSLSVCQMNTLITVLLLYEWNDILCHFACVIDWVKELEGVYPPLQMAGLCRAGH